MSRVFSALAFLYFDNIRDVASDLWLYWLLGGMGFLPYSWPCILIKSSGGIWSGVSPTTWGGGWLGLLMISGLNSWHHTTMDCLVALAGGGCSCMDVFNLSSFVWPGFCHAHGLSSLLLEVCIGGVNYSTQSCPMMVRGQGWDM